MENSQDSNALSKTIASQKNFYTYVNYVSVIPLKFESLIITITNKFLELQKIAYRCNINCPTFPDSVPSRRASWSE